MKASLITIAVILVIIVCPALMANNNNEYKTELRAPDYSLSLASHNQGIFQDQTLNQKDQTNAKNYKQHPRFKSERTATYLALFPGILIHGIGHLYAGDRTTGTILFGVEILVFLIAFDKVPGLEPENLWSYDRPNAGHFLSYACLFAFLGSWVYDFIHAGTAARNYNNRMRGKIIFSSDEYNDIKVSLSFAF